MGEMLRIEAISGEKLRAFVPGLARLRIEVFRDWPYLYDGGLDYEEDYLGRFLRAPDHVAICAFDGVKLVSTWHFMQPGDAFDAINDAADGWLSPLAYLVAAIFPAIAIRQAISYWRQPDNEQMLRTALAVMCAVSFSAISHIWPWYLIWTLALAALAPNWWLSRFILGLAILAPFTVVVWWIPEAEGAKNLVALTMYSIAILGTAFTAPSPIRTTRELPAGIRQFNLPWANGKPAIAVMAGHHEADYRPEPRGQPNTAPARSSTGLVT